jgi:hypothetical protein
MGILQVEESPAKEQHGISGRHCGGIAELNSELQQYLIIVFISLGLFEIQESHQPGHAPSSPPLPAPTITRSWTSRVLKPHAVRGERLQDSGQETTQTRLAFHERLRPVGLTEQGVLGVSLHARKQCHSRRSFSVSLSARGICSVHAEQRQAAATDAVADAKSLFQQPPRRDSV